ncbi:cell wall elongation regulator TseB-like domain-containing protein [Alkalihalobacillus deserti]|uniref:cell wall elongation regulator TseB-like domain-containing protein n=1 Tax=Alkalihalobacillus deserti TaxID=2879466 RepID=UPI001D1407CF|nr:DUF5590 domain-containing protein [Alkalihalobacillus deserti]
MKKWIIIVFFFMMISLTGAGVYAYQTIREPLLHNLEQAEHYVKGHLLKTVYDVSYYHGTEAFYVLNGLTEEEEDTVVWVSEDFSFHHTEKTSDGISKEDAIAIVRKEDSVKRIQSVKLGYERGLPIYEVTYLNKDNRKGYYYLTFDDGTFMKRYVLRTD